MMNESFERIVTFLRSVELLNELPLEALKQHRFACSEHKYRRESVIVNNSKDSEWIYIVKSGSCQVYKTMRSKPKEKRRKHASSKQQDNETGLPNGLEGHMFPPIKTRSDPVLSLHFRESPGTKSKTANKSLQLPKINPGSERRLVSQTLSLSDSGYASTQSDDEFHHSKIKHRHSKATRQGVDSEKKPSATSFVRLEVLRQGGVFGLQSFLYRDTPCLSLVSNGAECILISKQFLVDMLDSAALQRLRQKVPPYSSTNASTVMSEGLDQSLRKSSTT